MLLVNTTLDTGSLYDTLELARFLTELSVVDYFFVPKRASSVAVAALVNAMELLNLGDHIQNFLLDLDGFADLDPMSEEVEECRIRLGELFTQGGYSQSLIVANRSNNGRTNSISPVCVAGIQIANANLKK